MLDGKLVGVLVGMVSLGCGVESEPLESPQEMQERNHLGAGVVNPDWGCRSCGFTNSPMLGDEIVPEFTIGHVADPMTVGLVAVQDTAGKRYEVELQDGAVLAIDVFSGKAYAGDDLLAWNLVFEYDGHEFLVEIAMYEEHSDWVNGALIPTYSLIHDYPPSGSDLVDLPICPGYTVDATSVTFVQGAVYDQQALTVSHTPDFASIGCTGHLVAKLRFMGYAPDDGYGTDLNHQQAAMKMLAADYCGSGHSFTSSGTPLAWTDAWGNFGPWNETAEWEQGAAPYTPAMADTEARWDESGALCLKQPRKADPLDIMNECALPPPCEGGPHENATYGALLTSFNPSAP